MPSPPPGTHPEPPVRPGGPYVVHGIALFVVLAFFRLEKALYLRLRPKPWEWLTLFLPEIGFVLAFVGACALAGHLAGRVTGHVGGRRAGWMEKLVLPLALLAVYAVALADHIFFLRTGTRLRLDLVSYATGNFRMLHDLLASGVDAVLTWRAVLAGLCLALAASVAGKRISTGAATGTASPALRPTLAAVAVGLALTLAPPALLGQPSHTLAASPLPELLRGGFGGGSHAEGAALIPPEALYRAPELSARPSADRPPNLVLVILESTRADVTPPYAPPERWADTPELAALAGRAVVFDSVYTTVPHTSKALVGLLCGMYPRLEMPIVEAQAGAVPMDCLPKLLGRAGYRTAYLQTALAAFENRPGLVRNAGFGQAAFQETLRKAGPFARVGYLGMDEFAMLAPAVEWAARGGGEPFFLTLLTVTPHHPYEVSGEPWQGETRTQYLSAIRHQDRFVGELLRGLAAAGALADTVVVLVGDHGEAFAEHEALQHDAVPYEEVVRVPLLLLGPPERIGPPRHVGGLRHHLDLVPTVLALAGVPWEGTLLGRDLLASDGHERAVSFCWYPNTCTALRTGDRKVVYHFGRRPTEVFDLAADPGETRDLAPGLPDEEIEAAERALVSLELSVDGFYAGHPAPEGSALWWNETAEESAP